MNDLPGDKEAQRIRPVRLANVPQCILKGRNQHCGFLRREDTFVFNDSTNWHIQLPAPSRNLTYLSCIPPAKAILTTHDATFAHIAKRIALFAAQNSGYPQLTTDNALGH